MISDILIGFSLIFLLVGITGVCRIKGILGKLLTSSMVDTVAVILLVSGLILKLGFTFMTAKLVTVLLFILLTNPVLNHIITRAAYNDLEGEELEDD